MNRLKYAKTVLEYELDTPMLDMRSNMPTDIIVEPTQSGVAFTYNSIYSKRILRLANELLFMYAGIEVTV